MSDMTRPNRVDRVTRPICPQCGGWDMGNVGLVHHKASCPRNPCQFCGLEIQPGEKRSTIGTLKHPVHYDCLAEFELDRIDETEKRDDRPILDDDLHHARYDDSNRTPPVGIEDQEARDA